MRAILAKVVSEGTGTQAQVPGYEPAGKTGTAWIVQEGGGDETDGYLGSDGGRMYQASFVGMVNGADLSIVVTVRDPKTAVYGGDVAAPVFSHLAATALRRFQVPPPALVDGARIAVPELSASARAIEGEDVTGAVAAAAG
jgi:cell division protein FtsI (penicillin-binding protein 3)